MHVAQPAGVSTTRSDSPRGDVETPLHDAVHDAGFLELVAGHDEVISRVERHGADLRVENRAAVPVIPRSIDEKRQQGRADAAAPPGREHRHPADMAVAQQPSATNRPSVDVECECMR